MFDIIAHKFPIEGKFIIILNKKSCMGYATIRSSYPGAFLRTSRGRECNIIKARLDRNHCMNSQI